MCQYVVTPTPLCFVRAEMHPLKTASMYYCASVEKTVGSRTGRILVHVMERLSLAVASFLHGKEEHFIRIRSFSSAGSKKMDGAACISPSVLDLCFISLYSSETVFAFQVYVIESRSCIVVYTV